MGAVAGGQHFPPGHLDDVEPGSHSVLISFQHSHVLSLSIVRVIRDPGVQIHLLVTPAVPLHVVRDDGARRVAPPRPTIAVLGQGAWLAGSTPAAALRLLVAPELAPEVALGLLDTAHSAVLVTLLVRTLDPAVTELFPTTLLSSPPPSLDLLVAVVVGRDVPWLGPAHVTYPLHLLHTPLV